MAILLLFSFIAGFITILAPCIWPLLPVILSVSSAEGRKRPLGITLGIITSFTLFTLFIVYIEKIFHIDPNLFRLIAVVILLGLGVSMLFPWLGAKLEVVVSRVLGPLQSKFKGKGTGFAAGYVTGFSIGIVWAPCAGPILATIATLAATLSVNLKVVLVTLAYVGGLGIPLFFLSLAGGWVFERMRRFNKYTGRIQQAFGLVVIIAAVLIYTNYDKTLQVKILNAFPSYGNLFSQVEHNTLVTKELDALAGREGTPTLALKTQEEGALPVLDKAPEFTGIAHWLNTGEPLTMASLRGKVVLVDFWTYTCINCVRTLPYVTSWYDKYKDDGFVIVGVHTPEFAFEKKTENVQGAIKQFAIHYPVAQDNDYKTWRAYDNHYWPAKYLIDVNGNIRMTHFGEGDYEETEQAIRALLKEAGHSVAADAGTLQENAPNYRTTPETYLGSGRMERFVSNEEVIGGLQEFTAPKVINKDQFAYEGVWDISEEAAKATKGAALDLRFNAQNVFLVITPASPGDRITLTLDGMLVDEKSAGADVKDSQLVLDRQRLYHLIDLRTGAGTHLLRLTFPDAGTAVFAFTFG